MNIFWSILTAYSLPRCC